MLLLIHNQANMLETDYRNQPTTTESTDSSSTEE